MFQKIFAAVKIEESRKAWEQLTRKLTALTEQKVVETRAEERLRLEQLIEQTEQERQELEKKLLHLEQQRGGADSLPTSKASPSADAFSPDWSSAPWWVSALATIKLRYLLLLLVLGAGAIILSSQLRPSSSSLDQVRQGENNSTSLVPGKTTDTSEATMQAQSSALESSQKTAAGSSKGIDLTITTSGQGQITIGGDVINTGGNVEKSDAK